MTVYKQLVAPRTGTTDGAGWCLRFAQSFFGAPVKYASAWQAYQATARKQTGALPTGAAVLVWFSHYGTYQGQYANWGHVAVHVPGDGFYTSPWYISHGSEKYKSLSDIERIFSAKYVGWTDNINGLRVAEPAPIASDQRQAYPGGPENDVKRRAEPTTKSKDLGDPVPAGDIGTFDGWIKGESVSGNNVWFRGISGNWFWSGGFTSQSTSGLTDLNPKAPTVAANQRQVVPGGVENVLRVRKTASASGAIVKELQPGTIVTPEGWIVGESVGSNPLWYKTSGGYAWSGGFTKSDKSGLKDLTPVDPPKPAPEPEPEPKPEPKPDYVDFKAFSPVVTKVLPAHVNNYEVGNIPTEQTQVVLHDYGTFGRDTLGSTQNTFRNGTAYASAHLVISGQNIVQMVDLKNRAYHAGPNGNGIIGIEIDPVIGQPDGTPGKSETVASVKLALGALEEHFGNELTLRKHPEFMATSCGDDIDLSLFAKPVPEPEPEPTPEPEVPVVDNSELTEAVGKLTESVDKLDSTLKSIYNL